MGRVRCTWFVGVRSSALDRGRVARYGRVSQCADSDRGGRDHELPATLRYHYTLSIDSLSVAERADMEEYMRATLPNRIREEKGSEALGRLGVELQYCYFNPSGKLLLELAVAPTEYACEK